MLKLAARQRLGAFHNRASGWVMLRVIARPRVPAISNVKTAVSGTIRKTRRCTRLNIQHVFAPAVRRPRGRLSRRGRGSGIRVGVTWFSKRRCHSPPVAAGGGQCGDGLKLRWPRS